MTLQTCQRIYWPTPIYSQGSLSNRETIDAAGEYTAFIGCASENMTISHVGFLPGTVVGSGAAEIRIETVNAADGFPSGTLWNSPTNTTNVTTGALTSNTWGLFALTASASITVGQVYAVKILYNAGTSFITRETGAFEMGTSLPYRAFNTGTPTIAALTGMLAIALGSSSTTFYNVPGIFPSTNTVATNTFNNTNSAARGLKFQVPFKCRCIGIWMHGHTSVGDHNMMIQDDSGNELSSSSTTFEGDQSASSGGAGVKYYFFDNTVTLSPATNYRAVIQPNSATNTQIYTVTIPSADYRSATEWGSNSLYCTFTSGGGWVDTATDQIPLMGIIIDQLDDGVNSGSTLRAAGLHAIEQGI